MDLRICSQRFLPLAEISTSNFSSVFRAEDSVGKHYVALKMATSPDGPPRDALVREFNFLSRCNHPNIVQVYDFGSNRSGIPFFAMKWIQGHTLSHISKTFHVKAFLDVIPALCNALAEVHDLGYVYGDLNPSNVLLNKQNGSFGTTLIDFGMVAKIGSSHPGKLWGTPDFMAPEIHRGEPVSPATDVYSFGILLRRLFGGAGRTSPLPATEAIDPGALHALLRKCEEYYPESRPQDFREIENIWSQAVIKPNGKPHSPVKSGRSSPGAYGQNIYMERLRRSCQELKERGGGVVFVCGPHGIGKSTLVDRYRRRLQTQGNSTLKVMCEDINQVRDPILAAIESWVIESRGDGKSPESDGNNLYIFMESHNVLGGQSHAIDWLIQTAKNHRIICIIECTVAPYNLQTINTGTVEISPLSRTDFGQLSERLFAGVSLIPALSLFLYEATGGIPGLLLTKRQEYLDFIRHNRPPRAFSWRGAPKGFLTESAKILNGMPEAGQRIAQMIMTIRTPFSIDEIGAISNSANNVVQQWINYLVESGFLKMAQKNGKILYDTFSVWTHEALRKFAKTGEMPRGSDSTSANASPAYRLDKHRLTDFLRNPLSFQGRKHLPAIYKDFRYLPEAISICRQIISDGQFWETLPTDIVRSIFLSVISNYESVADQTRANRWALRLADRELQALRKGKSRVPETIAFTIGILDRYCAPQQKSPWISEVAREYPNIDDYTRALLISELGVFDLSKNETENALKKFFEAEMIFEKVNAFDAKRARNLNRIGIVYYMRKDYTRSLKYLRLAERTVGKTADLNTLAIIKFNTGLVLLDQGIPGEALNYLKTAQEHAKQTHNLKTLAFVARNMTLCVADLATAPEAVRAAEQALAASLKAGETNARALCYANLGWTHMRAGNVKKAHYYLTRTISLTQSTGDTRLLSIAYLNLARLSQLQSHAPKSVAFAIKSFWLARRIQSKPAMSEALREIAISLLTSEDPERAARLYRRSLRINPVTDNPRNRFFCDAVGTEIAIRLGNLETAENLLEHWRSQPSASLLPGWAGKLYHLDGLFHVASGRLDSGIKALKDSACRARKIGRYDLLLPAYEDLLQAYAKSTYSRAAIPYVRELYRLFRKVGRMGQDNKLEMAISDLKLKSDDTQFAGMVFKLSESLTRISDKDKLLDYLLGLAMDYFGADRGALISRHPVSHNLFIEAHRELGTGVDQNDTLEISKSVVKRVSRTSTPLKISNASEDPLTKTKKSIIQHNIQSVLCVPVFLNSDVWGVLYLDNRTVPGAFKNTDTRILQALANFMALAIEQSDEMSRLRLRGSDLIPGESTDLPFIAMSPEMRKVLLIADKTADSDATILIIGENGTGKDRLAEYIHYRSNRRSQPFITMNCAGFVETLADTELFGIESNVATGVNFREGKFKLADGGTLFLNEVGDLPLSIQAKVLQALQDGIIERVGGSPMGVNVRFIGATNKDLAEMVKAGEFRQDLFYRINPIAISIPPLRERAEDILPLAKSFLSHFCRKYGRNELQLKNENVDEFYAYAWPGNVRELKGLIERGVLLAEGEQFPLGLTETSFGATVVRGRNKRKLTGILDDTERRCILDALEKAAWNQSKAANWLGLHESTLRSKMGKLKIKKPRRL